MKRDIYNQLLEWKGSPRRKPLLLRGARQTGKTYILKEFGQNEYERVHYFNFEKNPDLESFFSRDLNPVRILSELSLYSKQEINPGSDLIIFDEIQTSNAALNSLKYFQEEVNEYHLAAAGSLLGIMLSSPRSFPVGKVDLIDLYPMTFAEFLEAMGESRYRGLVEEKRDLTPFSEAFHHDLVTLLRQYYFVGGMPEVVQYYCNTRSPDKVRRTQRNIIDAYTLDFAKHAPANDIPKLSLIWESIPVHLARENKKFIFSAVHKSARARDYENAIIWLEKTGLIYRSFAVEVPGCPLKGYSDSRCFKVYALDVGLLGALANVPPEILSQGNRLFSTYAGAFAENFVAQHLVCLLGPALYYWRSSGKKAEIDFLCEINETIYPLEVKAGINPRSKSLKSYDDQFHPPVLVRSTLLNLKRQRRIVNVPLYAVFYISQLLHLAEPENSWLYTG